MAIASQLGPSALAGLGLAATASDRIQTATGFDLEPLVLLTPGPLTTSERTRAAATFDLGSWDAPFAALTADVCARLTAILGQGAESYACVPLQGSGTFAVEAAVRTFVPPKAGLVVVSNGAYGERIAAIGRAAGRTVALFRGAWDEPVDPGAIHSLLTDLPSVYGHVAVVHCETSTGVLNRLEPIADVVRQSRRQLLVDAMSTFGAIDIPAWHPAVTAVVAASGKCLEGLPGMGFVLARRQALADASGQCDSLSLDLADQHAYLERTGQWRFTPPVQVVAALAQALAEHAAEGGRAGRLARYQANSDVLAAGLADLGLRPYLPADCQAPIIHTVYPPDHPAWDFERFYQQVRQRGFVIYPGKLTEVETFRVGCIGQIDAAVMRRAVTAISQALSAMGCLTANALTSEDAADASLADRATAGIGV
ncbi:MAG: 2-aminoethylphosphonate--pyruvate transaminase [Propionibacteriaceae bacterium]|jgi:2-aminoethylphosphonate-pyruvate transaminase|nr:2-aminoethylphosphonate--pyruvate transaminase [Propionibacteriaceae bacterium]